ncbi:MAG: leucine-rich repeat domain-containing protein [Muribaculaceae bacterium]
MRDLKIHTFLLLLAALFPAVSHAYDFKQGNLYYKILSEEELTVATAENNDIRNPTYSGDIDIPSYVTYNGKRYTVTEIGGFANSPNVTSVTIPETAVKVTHFYGGSTGSKDNSGWMIKAVTGPGGNGGQTSDGVSSLKEIHFNAINCTWCGFYSPGIPGLSQIISWSYPFPPSVERIIIGPKVTRLPEYAFYLCTKVKTLTIPASVTEIGRNIIKTESTDPVCQLAALNIYSSDLNCQWTLNDPSIINWKTTTFTAGMATLLGNPKDLIIPEGFTSVKKTTFRNSDVLKSVTFPSTMVEICDSAFHRSDIESVTFKKPYNLKKIGTSAFRLCHSLTSVDLPNTVTEIGADAFLQCWKLEDLTIPNSVNKIGESAFGSELSYGGALKRLTIADGANPISMEGDIEATDNIYIGRNIQSKKDNIPILYSNSVTFGEYVTELIDIRFSGELIRTVNLPEHLATIGDDIFQGCSNLTSIKLPSSLKSIGSHAFLGCTGLESITVPPSVQRLGYSVFDDNLQKLIIADGEPPITQVAYESGNSYINNIGSPKYVYIGRKIKKEKIEDKEPMLFRGSFIRTQTIEIGNNITEIEAYTFDNYNELKAIILPEKLISIGEFAFSRCTNLESVTMPKSLKEIGMYAFQDCSALTQIILPDGLESIGGRAFYNCSSLTDILLPASLNKIEYGTFDACVNLLNVVIKDGALTSIDNAAFYGCENLESVSLPQSLKEIGFYAFADCSSLKSIHVPNSVTKICQRAFLGCNSLTSVEIGQSVSQIEPHAFSKCPNLSEVIVYNTIPPYASFLCGYSTCELVGVFDEEVYSRATLSVPEGSIAAYRGTEPWSKFFNIKESGIEDVIADGNAEAEVAERQYYGIDGRVLGDKQPTMPGHYIERLRYADGKVTTNKIAVK